MISPIVCTTMRKNTTEDLRILLTWCRARTELIGESTTRNVRWRFVVQAPRHGRQLRQYLITNDLFYDHKTTRFFLSHTKSSPPFKLYIYIILSLFSPIAALVLLTLSRPSSSSSLKVNNSSFRHASPCLWNQLPTDWDWASFNVPPNTL